MLIFPKTILLFLVFFMPGTIMMAQSIERYNSFSYAVNEGLLQSTLSDVDVDKNNFSWFSFPNGIQKFDGKNFIMVPIQPGLPDDKMVKLLNVNGDLFFSHSQGISKYEISSNRFIQVFTHQERKPAMFIGHYGGVIYFYTVSGNIIGIDSHTFKVTSKIRSGFTDTTSNNDYRPKFSDNIINHKVAIEVKSCLYLWDLQHGKILYRSDPIESVSHYMLRLRSENDVLYYTYKINNALQLYNFPAGSNKLLYVKDKDDRQIARCVIYPWRKKMLISFNDRLYETDSSLQVIRSELVNFQNKSIGGSGIWKIMADNFDNLWVITIQQGAKKIIGNNYPLKYYGTDNPGDNKTLSLFADKENNRILAGTINNGLLIFDTLQRLIKHIKNLPVKANYFSINNIIKTREGNYLLFGVSQKNVWKLSKDLTRLDSIKIVSTLPGSLRGIHYFGNPLYQDDKTVISQSQGRFYKTDLIKTSVREYEVITSYTMSGLYYNGFIITHANDELLYLDTANLEIFKRVPLTNTSHVRCFTRGPDDNIYIGSNKGIFKIDSTGKVLYQWKKENGLPDDCIYALVFDNEGFLWCSTNRGIFKLNKDNSVLQLTKEDGLQENEFNTNVVQKSTDGELFFGGVNGISSFFPSAINSREDKVNLFFTHIKVNNEELFKDTAAWSVDKIELEYNQNSLSFDFIAMASNNPGQYVYQYRMDEVDDRWMQNNDMQTVRYLLQPGKYVFNIYASRFFDKDAKPMRQLTIVISPPFWKTWWFRLALAILVVAIMTVIINQFNKRKYNKKLAQLEGEHKLQLERERISRDLHDSIGAYANAVLYNTELLENEKEEKLREELMKDLKYASKDIITSLRETIWALKKDNYTAEECLMRIRNFVQPLTRYYQQVHFEIEGDVPAGKILHYSKALNLVRIVQEAVTNSIKHADAKNIKVMSNTRDNVWELVVTDDGKGFNEENIAEHEQGNGLGNMKQRAADAFFDLGIRSWEGTGTSVIIRINGEGKK